jgi:hypothetical protein
MINCALHAPPRKELILRSHYLPLAGAPVDPKANYGKPLIGRQSGVSQSST